MTMIIMIIALIIITRINTHWMSNYTLTAMLQRFGEFRGHNTGSRACHYSLIGGNTLVKTVKDLPL